MSEAGQCIWATHVAAAAYLRSRISCWQGALWASLLFKTRVLWQSYACTLMVQCPAQLLALSL